MPSCRYLFVLNIKSRTTWKPFCFQLLIFIIINDLFQIFKWKHDGQLLRYKDGLKCRIKNYNIEPLESGMGANNCSAIRWVWWGIEGFGKEQRVLVGTRVGNFMDNRCAELDTWREELKVRPPRALLRLL